jgi:hypothetical protein
LRVKSQEEVEGNLVANKDPNQIITTGYNPNSKLLILLYLEFTKRI